MSGGHMEVTIGGHTLTVPVHGTPEQTQALARAVDKKLRDIEAESDRIDTQAFALQAAMAFAAEVDRLKRGEKREEAKAHQRLERVSDDLNALVEQHQRG